MSTDEQTHPGTKNASWGAIISIIVIIAMVVLGAYYTWEKRIAQVHPATSTTATTTQN